MSKKSLQDTEENIEMVKTLYYEEKLTCAEVAQKIGIGADALRHFMKRNNISRRTTGEAVSKLTEDQVKDVIYLYLNEGLSCSEISIIYDNINRKTISNYLKKNNVQIDPNRISKTEQVRRESLVKLDVPDDTLIDLYCKQNLNATDIGKIYNVANVTVLRRLRLLNIPIKTLSDLLKNDNFRKLHINRIIFNATKEESLEKQKQTCLDKYGVDNPFKLELFQNKAKDTMQLKYGVNNVSKSPEIKEKKRKTTLRRFGVDNPMKNKNIREKLEQTNLKRYGTKYYIMTEDSRDKLYKSNIIKYGFINPFSNKEAHANFLIKARITMYENGTSPCSLAQKYLNELLKGELNYPISSLALDIAFPEEMIYCEWDGSGHNLAVQMGDLTQEKFDRKEINRHYYLKNKGWKRIRVISTKDYMPEDNIMINLINLVKEYFNKNHSWFEINIDEGKLKCSQYEEEYDFGELRSTYMLKKEIDNLIAK